jgi:hypothetical protein
MKNRQIHFGRNLPASVDNPVLNRLTYRHKTTASARQEDHKHQPKVQSGQRTDELNNQRSPTMEDAQLLLNAF